MVNRPFLRISLSSWAHFEYSCLSGSLFWGFTSIVTTVVRGDVRGLIGQHQAEVDRALVALEGQNEVEDVGDLAEGALETDLTQVRQTNQLRIWK